MNSQELHQQIWTCQHPYIQKNPVYKVYQGKKQNRLKYFQRVFIRSKLINYEMLETIQKYVQKFEEIEQISPDKNINKIQRLKQTQEKIQTCVRPYDENLEDYLKNNIISVKQAVFILTQVIEAVATLEQAKIPCQNLKPQNFVRVWNNSNYICEKDYQKKKQKDQFDKMGNDFRWKLNSLPEDYETFKKNNKKERPFQSQFIWNKQYQPPQFEKQQNNLSPEELAKSKVWNIGSIFIDIISGQHILTSSLEAKKLEQKNFDFISLIQQKTNRKIEIDHQLQCNIKKMLKNNPSDRMEIQKLFELKEFNKNIQIFKKQKAIQKFNKGSGKQKPNSGSNVQEKKNIIGNNTFNEKGIHKKNSIQDKIQLKKIKQNANFKNMMEFLNILYTIVDEVKIPLKTEEENFYKWFQESFNGSNKIERQPTIHLDIDSGTIKKHTNEIKIMFTQSIKPYKREIDKTFFIELACKKICTEFQNNQQNLYQNQEDEIFRNQFQFIWMRKIILFHLSQGLTLNQNIFKLGHEKYANQDCILMEEFYNEQWALFNESGVYNALKIFIDRQFEKCQNEIFEILSKIKNRDNDKLIQLYNNKNVYNKSYPLQSFMQCILNSKLFKIWFKQSEIIQKEQYHRLIAFYAYCMYSNRAHETNEEQVDNFDSIVSSKKKTHNEIAESFDFSNYFDFLEEAPIADIRKHYDKILEKLFDEKK